MRRLASQTGSWVPFAVMINDAIAAILAVCSVSTAKKIGNIESGEPKTRLQRIMCVEFRMSSVGAQMRSGQDGVERQALRL